MCKYKVPPTFSLAFIIILVCFGLNVKGQLHPLFGIEEPLHILHYYVDAIN